MIQLCRRGLLLSLVVLLALGEEVTLRTRLNTDQVYRSANAKTDQLYAVSVERVSSSSEADPSRCQSIPKTIQITNRVELFRLSQGKASARQEQVYEKLTALNEQENIIQQFELVGGKLFIITTQGDGYFLSLDPSSATEPQRVATKFFKEPLQGQFTDVIVIRDYKDRALVIGRSRVVLCKAENNQCDSVEGYEEMSSFRGAELYEDGGRYFLFVVQSHALIVYELTANGRVKNKRVLDATFFKAERISLRAIFRDGTRLLVLDDLVGLREVLAVGGSLQSFREGSRVIYEQYGCYQIVGQDGGESLALACAPSPNNYFILKLVKSHQFAEATYEPLETVFLHEKLYQIDYTENLLLSRVFSGVKLHWSSKQLGSPYPHFYRPAGDVFLHNAIQAKLKMIAGVKTILMAAEDELLSYELSTVDPSVRCSSSQQVREQYKLTYYFPCSQHVFMHQENVCTSEQTLFFEAWEHKELRVMADIIPFLLSLVGVIGIGYAVVKIYKKYGSDVQRARLKYNIQENELDS